jgi:hypothetical protein
MILGLQQFLTNASEVAHFTLQDGKIYRIQDQAKLQFLNVHEGPDDHGFEFIRKRY